MPTEHHNARLLIADSVRSGISRLYIHFHFSIDQSRAADFCKLADLHEADSMFSATPDDDRQLAFNVHRFPADPVRFGGTIEYRAGLVAPLPTKAADEIARVFEFIGANARDVDLNQWEESMEVASADMLEPLRSNQGVKDGVRVSKVELEALKDGVATERLRFEWRKDKMAMTRSVTGGPVGSFAELFQLGPKLLKESSLGKPQGNQAGEGTQE